MTDSERDLLLGCIGALMKHMQRAGEDRDLIIALCELSKPFLPPESLRSTDA